MPVLDVPLNDRTTAPTAEDKSVEGGDVESPVQFLLPRLEVIVEGVNPLRLLCVPPLVLRLHNEDGETTDADAESYDVEDEGELFLVHNRWN